MSRKIGALWSKKTQDGKSFLSGVLNDLGGDINIAVFKNDRKENDNHPDYNIVLSERKPQNQNTTTDDFGFGDSAPMPKPEDIPFG